MVAGIDPAKVTAAVDNISGFSDQLKTVAPDVNTIVADAKAAVAGAKDFADNLTAQKDNLNAIVADAKELADRLNAASTKIDSVLGKAEELLGDEEGVGKNFFQEAAGRRKGAARDGRDLQLRAADEITAGLADFSGRGLADISSPGQRASRLGGADRPRGRGFRAEPGRGRLRWQFRRSRVQSPLIQFALWGRARRLRGGGLVVPEKA